MVALLNFFLACLILAGILLCFAHGLLYLVLVQVCGGGDGDLLLIAGAKILSAYMHYAVGVDIEGDFNLRYSARRGSYTCQLEAAKGLVILRHLALALQHMYFNAGLTIRSGGEYLALFGGDGGVAVYQAGEYAADSLNTK